MKKTVKKGFTLIELVVVLAIIAALAGLVIPQVAMLGRTTDMAASASSQKELANNIQLFFVLQKRYPQGFDSLLDGTGALYATDNPDSTLQTRGLPAAGADGTSLNAQLTATTLVNTAGVTEWVRSFTRAGFEYVYDHDTALINSNNSATIRRPTTGVFSSTATMPIAEVTGTALIAKLSPNNLLPVGTLPANERLVAVGIGPRNSALSKTILNSPIYPGADGRYYGRFIAVFKIYANGERATLVGVIDSYGRHPDYTIQQYSESLPDGSRQG